MTIVERAHASMVNGFLAAAVDWAFRRPEARPARAQSDRFANRHSINWFAGIAALGFSVVLVIAIGISAILTTDRLREGFGWVRHTNEVLLELSRVEEGLLEQRAALRGFVITGNTNYTDIYRQNRAEVADALNALLSLVTDNPPQIVRVWKLRTLLTARLLKFDHDGGLSPERRLAIANDMRGSVQGPGFLRTDLVSRSLLNTLRAEEVLLLSQRQQKTEDGVALLLELSVFASVLALLSGTMGVFLIKRERGALRLNVLQAELMHAQRLDLVNQSSAMLAHELSQPLTAAANYLAALKRASDNASVRIPDNIADLAMRARAQIARASGIVTRLHRFVDKHVTARSHEALATLIDDAVSLLGTLDASIALQISVEPGLPEVAIDRVQVQQVLVNLMRNAIEAMHGNARSTLSLRVTSAAPDCVLFSLADNGPGLSREIAGRLFQPFITTKKDGLGVGLSICRTIIVDHGGKIWANSNPGMGTVFHFTLPTVPLALAA